jgi:hypothetical protein
MDVIENENVEGRPTTRRITRRRIHCGFVVLVIGEASSAVIVAGFVVCMVFMMSDE